MCALRSWLLPALVAGFVLLDVGVLAAQPLPRKPTDRRPNQPAIPPILDLTRRGGDNRAIDYMRYRERENVYSELRRLEGEVSTQRENVRSLESESGRPTTGHPVYFMNYSHYYRFPKGSGSSGSGVSLSRPTASRGSERASR